MPQIPPQGDLDCRTIYQSILPWQIMMLTRDPSRLMLIGSKSGEQSMAGRSVKRRYRHY
jgi:hypothetical protein